VRKLLTYEYTPVQVPHLTTAVSPQSLRPLVVGKPLTTYNTFLEFPLRNGGVEARAMGNNIILPYTQILPYMSKMPYKKKKISSEQKYSRVLLK